MHSDEILSLTVYQLFLRAFTKEGTLAAAARHLSEIKDLGVDVVYVCPFMVEDAGEDGKRIRGLTTRRIPIA